MNEIIRSLTFGSSNIDLQRTAFETELKNFFSKSYSLASKNNLSFYTSRLSAEPLSVDNEITDSFLNSFSNRISALSNNLGFRWFCIPFNFSKITDKVVFDLAFNLLKNKNNAFVHCIFDNNDLVEPDLLLGFANLNLKVSKLSNNGFDNFRLGASFNVNPNTPFFPFSYSSPKSGFSFASDSCEIFLNIINSHPKLSFFDIKNMIVRDYSRYLETLNFIGKTLESETGFKFYGIDCSLAPFPSSDKSVAKIIELLGNSEFGSPGTLSIVSFLTNIIKESITTANVDSVGFNGAMLSVLEDDVLSHRASQRNYDINSLLLYSSVCGCGLDMIPLSGNVLAEELASIHMDLIQLSKRYKKPLGIRFLPIPNREAGEIAKFSHDFLVDTRIFKNDNQFIEILKYNY